MSDAVFSEMPCLIELYGHGKIAGKVSEVAVAGSALIRVDVPAVEGQAAFTKYYGVGAIYAITPTDEATMLAAVNGMKPKPVERYQFALPGLIPRPTLSDESGEFDDDDLDDEDFEDDDFEDDDEED